MKTTGDCTFAVKLDAPNSSFTGTAIHLFCNAGFADIFLAQSFSFTSGVNCFQYKERQLQKFIRRSSKFLSFLTVSLIFTVLNTSTGRKRGRIPLPQKKSPYLCAFLPYNLGASAV